MGSAAPTVLVERVGSFTLRRERDRRGRDVRVTTGEMTLVLDHGVPTGTLHSPYLDETWSKGRARGTSLDMPYGHENDTDKRCAFGTWVAECMRLLRSQVFFALRAPSTSVACAAWRYARDHALLEEHVHHPAADTVIAKAAMALGEADLRQMVACLARRGSFRQHTLLAVARALGRDHLVLRGVAIPDDDARVKALAAAGKLARRHREVGADVRDLNRCLGALVARGRIRDAAALSRAVGAVILATLPGDEYYGARNAYGIQAACDEHEWRLHAASVAMGEGDRVSAGIHAKRARTLARFLEKAGVRVVPTATGAPATRNRARRSPARRQPHGPGRTGRRS